MSTRYVLGLGLFSFCLASGTAAAQSVGVEVDANRISGDYEVRSKVVYFADLNLARAAGVQTLYRRIRAAANYVCAPWDETRDLAQFSEWRACRDSAIANAVSQIDHPLLSEHHLHLMAANQRGP